MAIPFDADRRRDATSPASAIALDFWAEADTTTAGPIDVAADVPATSPWLLSGGVGPGVARHLRRPRAAHEGIIVVGVARCGAGRWL